MTWFETPPGRDAYEPFYHTYVSRVPAGNLLTSLEREMDRTLALLRPLDEDAARTRYAPDKWSVKEVLGHLVDTERVFATRCLAFARGDPGPYPSMEQDQYIAGTELDRRPLAGLLDEFEHLRRADLALFGSLTDREMDRRGTASGFTFTAGCLPFIICGHEIHHRGVLHDRYDL